MVYSTFESNEAMYAKIKLLQGKGYDIVVPSGYFVDRMRQEGLLQRIEHSKLSNFQNIDQKLLNQEYAPGNLYSIPYMWGIAGLAYNMRFVPEGSLTQWKQLLRPEYSGKILLTDDLRDAFGLALKANGCSLNTIDSQEIRSAYGFLAKLKSSIRVFDVTAVKQALISEEVWIGTIWNGDYLVAKEENKNLAFVFPEEGAMPWVDSFTILSGAKNVDNAYSLIN